MPAMKIPDTDGIMKALRGILNHGVDGIGPLSSSESLAEEYLRDRSYRTTDDRVRALIRWEATKSFGAGFIAGLGGLVALPMTIPASLYASWVVQARLAGAVASLYGYSTGEDRVRTFILISILGDAGKEVVKGAGITITNKIVMNAVERVPDRVFEDMNRRIGARLFSIGSTHGAINLSKLVPVVGGLLGGIADSVSCVIVGNAARRIFMPEKYREYAAEGAAGREYNIIIDGERLSRIVSAHVEMVESLEMPEEGLLKIRIRAFPLSITYRLARFDDKGMTLKTEGGFFRRKILGLSLARRLKNLPERFRDVISYRKGSLTIDINEIIRSRDGVRGVAIENIAIVKDQLRIRLG